MTFKKPTGQFIPDFVEGAKKGVFMVLFTNAPALIMMYPVLWILDHTGIMSFLSGVLGPVMSVWGLPAEGLVVIVSGMLNNAAGVATILSYFEAGVLTGKQVAIITPMAWMTFYLFQNIARILTVEKIESKYYLPIMIIAIITGAIVGWLGLAAVSLLF